MAKRQAKVIYRAPKKNSKNGFSLKLFSLPIFLGFIIVTFIFGFENFSSHLVTANQNPSPEPLPLVSSNFFEETTSASNSPELIYPITQHLEQSLDEQLTSESASIIPTQAPDFCLDLPIVMYHHIEPMQLAELLGHPQLTVDSYIFEDQIKYLKENGYNPISTDSLVQALLNRKQLPEKSIMITIDDGYDDNFTYAFMTAKKYQFIINFMIPTGLIGNPGYMNWDHLKEMAINPYARLYNHTSSHAALGGISKDAVIQEVTTANNNFESNLGIKNRIITYPYGSYNDETITTLKEIGMIAAITTDPGRTQCLSNIMNLPRLRVANAPMSEYGF